MFESVDGRTHGSRFNGYTITLRKSLCVDSVISVNSFKNPLKTFNDIKCHGFKHISFSS